MSNTALIARLRHLADTYYLSDVAYDGLTEAADALTAQAAEIEALRADAARYQWIKSQTSASRDKRGRCEFEMPDPHPFGRIMQGSIAQHLDAAIDAALAGKAVTP